MISIISQQIKNISMEFALNDPSKNQLWRISANTGFINNLIDASGHPSSGAKISDSIIFNVALSFKIAEHFDISIYRYYDLIEKTLKEQNIALTWYIHCWRADFNWSTRQDNVSQFGFTISISAVPQFRFSKPTTAVPDYMNMIGNFQNVY
jgi:hypothetical protein